MSAFPDPFAGIDQTSTTQNVAGQNSAFLPNTSSSTNPFTDVLNHTATWNQSLYAPQTTSAVSAPSSAATTASPFSMPNGPTKTSSSTDVLNPDLPGDGSGGGTGGGGTGSGTQGGGGTGGSGTGGGSTGGKGQIVGNPTGINPTTGRPYAFAPPAGVDPSLWNDVDRYAQIASGKGGNWSALYQNPQWVADFRNWSAANDPTGSVRIEDYLEATHPELHGLSAQSGSNTYQSWLATHGGSTYGAPGSTGAWGGWGYLGGGLGGHGGAGAPPPVTTPPPVTPPPSTTPPPASTGGGTTPPPGGPGQPPSQIGPPVPNPNPAPTPGGTGTTGTGNPNDEIQNLINTFNQNFKGANQPDIEKMLDPMFARQQQLLSQQLQAQAALTPGRLQSGGFGQNEAQALSDLSGQQSATLAGALQQQAQAQMQQNTAIMQLSTQAGMQQYVADLNADVQKYGINTNADLQKYLDQQDNTLKKYGIDTNDVLERYKADLALKGEEYSADRSVDAASLHAAAAEAAANAASAASMANAQLQYQLGLQGLQVTRENNIGNFILGLLGIGGVDINSLNGILQGLPSGLTIVH